MWAADVSFAEFYLLYLKKTTMLIHEAKYPSPCNGIYKPCSQFDRLCISLLILLHLPLSWDSFLTHLFTGSFEFALDRHQDSSLAEPHQNNNDGRYKQGPSPCWQWAVTSATKSSSWATDGRLGANTVVGGLSDDSFVLCYTSQQYPMIKMGGKSRSSHNQQNLQSF